MVVKKNRLYNYYTYKEQLKKTEKYNTNTC